MLISLTPPPEPNDAKVNLGIGAWDFFSNIVQSEAEIQRVVNEFVGRKDLLNWLEQKIANKQQFGVFADPLINFWGVTGIGKTYLLKYIKYRYGYMRQVEQNSCAVYLDFESVAFNDNERQATLTIMRVLTQLFLAEIEPSTTPDDIADEYKQISHQPVEAQLNLFLQTTLRLAERCTPILLLDTAEKISAEYIYAIEDELLEPLLLSDKVLIIIAGRRNIPHWNRFEVRRREDKSAESKLAALSNSEAYAILEKRNATAHIDWSSLYRVTAGMPRLITELLDALLSDPQRIATKQKIVADDEAVRHIVLPIIKAYQAKVLNTASREQKLFLDILLPLRRYRTDALRWMIETLSNPYLKQLNNFQLLRVLRELDQTLDIVWWDSNKGEYVTEASVRRVFEQIKRLQDEAEYVALHEAALGFYQDKAEKYPRTSTDSLVEATFHQAILSATNLADFELFAFVWQFANAHLPFDEVVVLQEAFRNLPKKDSELGDQLGEMVISTIVNKLETVLERKGN